jgi:SAM-dependent methyltransferase
LAELGHLSRCLDTELLDNPSLPEDAVARAYRELHRTHSWLGNTAVVLRLLRQDPIPIRSVLDIGCGHGALLLEIRRRLGAEVIGFDLRKASAVAPVPILTGDAVTEPLPRADVAISVLCGPPLSGANLVRLIRNVFRSLVVTALDHDHGFKLEAFNIDQLLKKGDAVTIEFTADKAGTFPFECSHFCGLGHKRMKGELVVE